MIKRIRKLGRNRALILDKSILELMGLEASGLVQVILTNGSLIVTPVNPHSVSKAKFEKCVNRVMRTRRDLLKCLGDN